MKKQQRKQIISNKHSFITRHKLKLYLHQLIINT